MDWLDVTVGTSYEDGVVTVGFAVEEGARALLFSRSDSIDEQDALLGMDTYCISTETGANFYGGVESARLNGAALELRLGADAVGALGLPGELVLRFRAGAPAAAAADALRHVGIVAESI